MVGAEKETEVRKLVAYQPECGTGTGRMAGMAGWKEVCCGADPRCRAKRRIGALPPVDGTGK